MTTRATLLSVVGAGLAAQLALTYELAAIIRRDAAAQAVEAHRHAADLSLTG